jgi:hypothetical protein
MALPVGGLFRGGGGQGRAGPGDGGFAVKLAHAFVLFLKLLVNVV